MKLSKLAIVFCLSFAVSHGFAADDETTTTVQNPDGTTTTTTTENYDKNEGPCLA